MPARVTIQNAVRKRGKLNVTKLRENIQALQTGNKPHVRAAWKAVAAELESTTLESFQRQADPWGRPWAPHSEHTLMHRLTRTKGGRKRLASTRRAEAKGKMTKTRSRVNTSLLDAQLLIDKGTLRRGITAKATKRGAYVGVSGPSRAYAGVQQFGNPDNRMYNNAKGRPAPIPPRPFLPLVKRGKRPATVLPEDLEQRVMRILRDAIYHGVR